MKWTEDQIRTLIGLYESGKSRREIMEILGIENSQIIGKLQQLRTQGLITHKRQDRAAVPRVIASAATSEPIETRSLPQSTGKERDRITRTCMWPLGTPGETDFRYCGQPRGIKYSYCKDHEAIAHPSTSPIKYR
jgi:GcrA cell cycle regulator